MHEIMEEYGTGLLSLAAGTLLIAAFLFFLRDGGVLHTIVQEYMTGICG